MNSKKKIAIVGAGAMGLTAAYELLKEGHSVTVFEKDDRIGGMSASFDFDGLNIERYYHFFCKPDDVVFDLLKELGIDEFLKWRETKMGFFYNGNLYKWGNPLALFSFPHLGFFDKVRFGLQAFLAIRRKNWDKLDGVTAVSWIKGFVGEKAYDILWDSLFSLKFHEYKDNLSAAWVGRRLKRVGVSRKSMFTEWLGYLEGGVIRLFEALQERIEEMGGQCVLKAEVSGINLENDKVSGLTVNGVEHTFDKVITTVPLPYIPGLAPGLPVEVINKYKKLENIGVVCVIFKLKRPLTENFWLNISDKEIFLPGIIEYSNLNPLKEKIAYFPYYIPRSYEKYSMSGSDFIEEVLGYCKKINPDFSESDVLGSRVHRYEYAQPVCPPGFREMLPPVETPVEGLYVVDTSYYYPEDRSISGSVEEGQRVARMLKEKEGKRKKK
ncbi:MAG: NAD(P)/FAD-dependent oxidoreductase [bacterium]|nr:NAD(P)/FAD-dependent oxidoreductase [bacterium]